MNSLQAWIVVGVPGVMVAAGLFVGRSQVRAWFGYGVLAALLLFFVFVPRDSVSAAVIGLAAVGFVAAGRGSYLDREVPEHHHNRRRLTTDPSQL